MTGNRRVLAQDQDDLIRDRLRLLLFVSGTSLFLIGGWLSGVTSIPFISGLVMVLGVPLVVLSVTRVQGHRRLSAIWGWLNTVAAYLKVATWQVVVIYFGIVLSIGSRAAAGNARLAHSPWHSLLWVAGIGFVILGCWRRDASIKESILNKQDLAFILLLFIAALVFRGIYLETFPYSLTGDEGETGLYALQFIQGKRNNLLDMGWNEFPALFFWFASLSQRILGLSITAIRIVSVIGGSLCVVAVYWATKEMFNRNQALFAAFFLSSLHVHIIFSRVAVNNIWDGFFLFISLGAVWVAWRDNARWSFILAGVAIGFSQFFYTTGHLTPIYALSFVLLLYLFNRKADRLPGLVTLILVLAAVLFPLGLYYLDNWQELVTPMSRVFSLADSVDQTYIEGVQVSAVSQFFLSLRKSALGIISEPLLGIYKPTTPILFPFSATLFLAGLIICLVQIKHPRYAILLLGILGPLLAGAMSQDPPNSQRLLLLAPLLAVIASIGAKEFETLLRGAWPKYAHYMFIVPLAFLVITMANNLVFTFDEIFNDQRFSGRGELIAREVSEWLDGYPPGTRVYFIGPAEIGFNSIPSLPYLSPHVLGQDLIFPLEEGHELPPARGNLIIVFPPSDFDYFDEIQAFYPEAEVEMVYEGADQLLFRALIP